MLIFVSCRLLSIWQDRNIFDAKVQAEIAKVWTAKSLKASSGASKKDSGNAPAVAGTPPPAKKPKVDSKFICMSRKCNFRLRKEKTLSRS